MHVIKKIEIVISYPKIEDFKKIISKSVNN